MTDASFGEEFDTVVDEITDEYLRNELPDDERQRIQRYFLSSTERRQKLEFAAELLRRAQKPDSPNLFEQIAAFFKQPSFARLALTAATVIIVVSIPIYLLTRPATYIALNLDISTAERSEGAAAQAVKLPSNAGLRVVLKIPESGRGAKGYVAKLAGDDNNLKIEQSNEQTVTVVIPAGKLNPGTYAIQLSRIKPDNSVERISGSYYFAVEKVDTDLR